MSGKPPQPLPSSLSPPSSPGSCWWTPSVRGVLAPQGGGPAGGRDQLTWPLVVCCSLVQVGRHHLALVPLALQSLSE
jgi:hypothetical protein